MSEREREREREREKERERERESRIMMCVGLLTLCWLRSLFMGAELEGESGREGER